MITTRFRPVWLLVLCAVGFTIHASAAGPVDNCFKNLPAGCFIKRSVMAPRDQVVAIGRKLGAEIERISNTFLTVQGAAIQVNILEGKTESDAAALYKAISRMKSDPAFCLRKGARVVEYVTRDAALALKTSYELGFIAKPKYVRYRVTAKLALIEKADYMALNELFNLFLSTPLGASGHDAPPEIAALRKRFVFGRKIALRAPGDPTRLEFDFDPRPEAKPGSDRPDIITLSFDSPPASFGVPYVTLTALVGVDDTGFTPTPRKADESLLSPTLWWPADDPRVKELVKQIVSEAPTQEAKVQAILAWLTPGTNIKFGGPVTGSRWGVKKVLQQKYGHCWDFADCFVTFCRAAGIPCRQVAGWLFGTSGHVWAEVLVDGKGWQQVDATGGGKLNCGIYHIPYFTTEDGEMPVLYLSMPKIDIVETK